MGPDNPWSPNWRPDTTGTRMAAIRSARRGAVLAGALFVPIGIVATQMAPVGPSMAAAVVVIGVAGVALLGAGLAPATSGSRVDAAAAGLAMAVGAPVAAVTSLVIAGLIGDLVLGDGTGYAATAIRTSVTVAVRIAPLVALGATVWVVAVRRGGDPGPPASGPGASPRSESR